MKTKFLDSDFYELYFWIAILLGIWLILGIYTTKIHIVEKKRFLILRSYNVDPIPKGLAKLKDYRWNALLEDAKKSRGVNNES